MSKARYPFGCVMRLTSAFGERVDPITGAAGAWHGGVDLVGIDGRVLAVMSGVVVVSQIVLDRGNPTWEWGNYVCVLGDDGRYCYYCHLAERAVAYGARVEAGQLLGYMGSTGKSTGTHLHFEVRDGANVQLNAAAYLGIENCAGVVVAPPDGDNVPAEWAREAVEWAQSAGILRGDGAGDLHLREACTREMALVFLWRAMAACGKEVR